MITDIVESSVETVVGEESDADNWNLNELNELLLPTVPLKKITRGNYRVVGGLGYGGGGGFGGQRSLGSGAAKAAVKIYPNDPCPCGSGKKYKKCCGKNK